MKRVIAIIMILVGVTCLGVGGYLNFMTGENDSDTSTKEDNGSPNNTKVNDDSLKLTDVKDYSEYSNYNLKMVASITSAGNTVQISSDGSVDAKNKIINTSLTSMGVTQYVYYDFNNQLQYYSSDNNTWEKNVNTGTNLPDFTNLITKIKSSDGVVKNDSGEYSYNSDLVVSGVNYTGVKTIAKFTNDGYLSKISYEFPNVDETIENYVITYEFSSINKVGDITIPETIVNGSVQGNVTLDISYVS